MDHFLSDLTHLALLSTAFDIGLVELLEREPSLRREALRERLELDRRTHGLLLEGLLGMDVLDEQDGELSLTGRFRKALEFRDLLMVTMELGMMSARDVVEGLPTLIRDRRRYLAEASLFRFFEYVPGHDWTEEQLGRTAEWVRAISTLTRYESQILLDAYDFGRHRSVLDVGGNSGELLRQICAAHDGLEGTVLDLPVVCEVGRRMTEGHAARDRIRFESVDIRNDPFPSGHDLVVFKSFLHDWEAKIGKQLLAKARDSLAPGGRVLIVEKRPVSFRERDAWSDSLMWFPYYAWRRSAQRYAQMLEQTGLTGVHVEEDLPRELSLTWGERAG